MSLTQGFVSSLFPPTPTALSSLRLMPNRVHSKEDPSLAFQSVMWHLSFGFYYFFQWIQFFSGSSTWHGTYFPLTYKFVSDTTRELLECAYAAFLSVLTAYLIYRSALIFSLFFTSWEKRVFSFHDIIIRTWGGASETKKSLNVK